MLATPPCTPPFKGLGEALERLLRPAVGFHDPGDVLKDPHLSVADKRAILSSWASDACAIEGRPDLRWMLGTDEPVRLSEIREALARLERQSARHGGGGNAQGLQAGAFAVGPRFPGRPATA